MEIPFPTDIREGSCHSKTALVFIVAQKLLEEIELELFSTL